jgi:hypothetical protein
MSETIDITPTWAGILPGLIRVLEGTKDAKARQTVIEELQRMARAADQAVAHAKEASNG